MRTDLFDFVLPDSAIALYPAEPRDSARLLVVHSVKGGCARDDADLDDKQVRDLPDLLRPGDALVFNDTKVIPAALSGVRMRGETRAHVDFNLTKRVSDNTWRAFARPAKRLEAGDRVHFGHSEDVCLQGVLDAMDSSPAFIRTVSWDVVAWNAAAAVVLTDYDALLPVERNILRLLFLDQRSRTLQLDWEGMAKFVVAVFRADIARARADVSVEPLVEELRQASADFARIWDDGDVRGFGDGLKQLRHPVLGDITLEYSAFSVDGRPDLSMLVYNTTNTVDAGRIRALKAGQMKA